MAELRPGPLGSISGKVGNVVASNWRDIAYVRGVSKRSKREASAPQKEIQVRFKMLTDFLNKIKSVVDLGFGYRYTGRATAFNLAVRKNMEAVGGELGNVEIDYPAIKLSAGNLVGCDDVKFKSDGPGQLEITWTDLDDQNEQFANDKLVMVLHNAEKNVSLVRQSALRHDKRVTITVPIAWSGDELHGYLFFHNAVLKKNSETVYFGPVFTM